MSRSGNNRSLSRWNYPNFYCWCVSRHFIRFFGNLWKQAHRHKYGRCKHKHTHTHTLNRKNTTTRASSKYSNYTRKHTRTHTQSYSHVHTRTHTCTHTHTHTRTQYNTHTHKLPKKRLGLFLRLRDQISEVLSVRAGVRRTDQFLPARTAEDRSLREQNLSVSVASEGSETFLHAGSEMTSCTDKNFVRAVKT